MKRQKNAWQDDAVVVVHRYIDPYSGEEKVLDLKAIRKGRSIHNSDYLSSSNKLDLLGHLGATWQNIGSGYAVYRYADVIVPRAKPKPLYLIDRDDLADYFDMADRADRESNPVGTVVKVRRLLPINNPKKGRK